MATNDSLVPISWRGADESGDRYKGRDPRDVASQIKREARSYRYDRKGIFQEAGVKGMHWGVHKPKDISNWTKTSGPLGSNPGGLYHDGKQEYYVKFPTNEKQAQSEVLANSIYQTLGIKVPDSELVELNGKLGVGSPMIDGAKTASKQEQIASDELKKGFLADVLLANHDVVGLDHDNIIKAPNGDMFRIDNGGSMFFRAQGAPKWSYTGENINELVSMRNTGIAKQAGAVFQSVDLNSKEQQDQAARIKNILTDDKIKNLVANAGFTGEEADKYEKTLADRRNLIGVLAQSQSPTSAAAEKTVEKPADAKPTETAAAPAKSDDDEEGGGKKDIMSDAKEYQSRKDFYQNKEPNPKRAGGYFLNNSIRGKIYNALDAAKGDWMKISDFKAQWPNNKVESRIGRMKLIGKWTGRWQIEVAGDNIRMFTTKQAPEKGDATKILGDIDRSTKAAKDIIAFQEKAGALYHPDMEPILANYYKSAGVSTQSKNMMDISVRDWTTNSDSHGAGCMRQVASKFYGRTPDSEYPKYIGSSMNKGTYNTQADLMKDSMMANKALAGAYAKEKGITVLYRGVDGDAADRIKAAIKKGDEVELPVNALSSWSSTEKVAWKFAHSDGVVLKLKVDTDNIWASHDSTPKLFTSHSHEKEYIVGHKKPFEKFKKDDVKIGGYH